MSFTALLRVVVLCAFLGSSCLVLSVKQRRTDALEEACKGKNSGDLCSAITASNRSIEGSCFSGAPPGVEHAPPLHCRLAHPGEVACNKKAENDECSFSRPGDVEDDRNGKCFKTPHGTLMCRLGEMEAPNNEESDDGILPPHLACKNLTVGDTCKTRGPFSEGVCTSMTSGNDARLHCRMVPPTERACNGKKADDDCSFERGGGIISGLLGQEESDDNKENGTCVSMAHHNDESVLLCRPNGRAAHKGARLSSDPELSAKVARLQEIRQQPNFQSDAKLVEELTKLKSEIHETRSSLRGNV